VGECGARAGGLASGGVRALEDRPVHGAAEPVDGQDVHAAVADDRGGVGHGVQHLLQPGPDLAGGAAAGAGSGVGGAGQVEQVGAFGAVAAEAGPGKTVVVVGDGAVGLCGVLAAKQLGAERIIALSRHAPHQELARQFGATDIVVERGHEGVTKIKEMTNGLGAHSVIEAVGTQESMMQAIRSTRPGGHVGYVGVAHGVELPVKELFFSHMHLHGGPAPVRRFLPKLIELIWNRGIDPGKVFDLTLPLEQAAEGYQAMDERRAIKVLLTPDR
jgi:threonine dehydrogenase-like Zn-dependent dehydrogenase